LTRADTPLPPINHQLSTINQQQSVQSVSKLLAAKERKELKMETVTLVFCWLLSF
jgi:hypothetical protein